MKPTFQRVALAAVLGFGLVVTAAAQDRGPGPGPGGPPGVRGGDRQKLFEDMQHRREQRLHDLLQIKPEQEAAFRTYVTTLEQLRPQRGSRRGDGPGRPGARGSGAAGEQGAQLTASERLDRAAQRLAEAQQRLQKTSAATKTFYATLSPEQRKAFDAMPTAGRGRGGRGFERAMLMRGRVEGPPPR